MKLAMGLLASALVLAGHVATANAAALKPAGKYAFTSTDGCEAKFTFTFGSYKTANDKTDSAVHVINSVANGNIGAAVGYMTFTPTTATGGNFAMTLTDITGGALRINNGGVNVATKQQSFSGKYTFTANSMTITPTAKPALAFVMTYGTLSAAGAPTSVHLVRRDPTGTPTGNCVQSIIATK